MPASEDRPHRRFRPRWLAVAAVAALLLIAAGVALIARPDHHDIDAGSIPARPPTSPSRAPVTAFTNAPTVPVSGTATPAAGHGTAASTAPTPVGTNVLPIRVVRLQIPVQHVDAPVVDVGVGANGLDIPPDPRVLGRWSGGANPGEPYGSVVVAGHVDNNGVDGVLFHLGQLPVGATVVAVGSDGRRVTYTVTGLRQVPKLSLAGLDVFTQTTQARLVLITCGGTFDYGTRSYADNVVAFAVPTAAG